MIAESIPAVTGLSVQEKWQLANELLAEVEANQEELPNPEGLLDLVRRRFDDFERDPSTAMSLEEFKAKHSLP